MESAPGSPTAAEASAALRDAEASRGRLADGIALPPWFFTSLGVAISGQIATTAIGVSIDRTSARWALAGGLLVFVVVAGAQLARFRRLNGVWLGGLNSRAVLGTGNAASVSYMVALGAAVWAAFAGLWVLVGASALIGGAAYAVSGSRWMNAYRADPATHSPGESAAWLSLVGLTAVAGLVLLLALGR